MAALQWYLRHLRESFHSTTVTSQSDADLPKNLVKHDASVLKAFSPYFAGDWFVRNKTQGWLDLGGILLAFTGVEALFADLGAFSKRCAS